jgi:cation-transporting ATPase 13A2
MKPVLFTINGKSHSQIYKELGTGVSEFATYAKRQKTFGLNQTQVPMKTNWKIMMDEILSPFYVFQVYFLLRTLIYFQIFSCILWWSDHYETYATMIFIISILSLAASFRTTKRNYKILQEKTVYETQVRVRRPF